MTYLYSFDDSIPQRRGRLNQCPMSGNEFGFFADRRRPAKAPRPPAKLGAPSWRIVPSARGEGYGLVFPWPIQASDALKFVFVDGQLPPGFRLEKDRAGKSEIWRLFMPSGHADRKSHAEKYTFKLADALGVAKPNMKPFAEEQQRNLDEARARGLLKHLQ